MCASNVRVYRLSGYIHVCPIAEGFVMQGIWHRYRSLGNLLRTLAKELRLLMFSLDLVCQLGCMYVSAYTPVHSMHSILLAGK